MTGRAAPDEVWGELMRGNARFVGGTPAHPRQDVGRRHQLAAAQRPRAALFGCSDSRLAAEIIFDLGLGDLFVVRNAGQVISDSVVGSLEYAVAVLDVSLIVVLGHDECGAVAAAIDSIAPDAAPLPAQIWRHIAPIVPAVRRVQAAGGGPPDPDRVGREHLRDTVAELLRSSELIAQAVADGRTALVAATYRLDQGVTEPDFAVGDVPSAARAHHDREEHP